MDLSKPWYECIPTLENGNKIDLSFEEFVDTLNEYAKEIGALDSTGKYCEADAWLEKYEEGLTPYDAWWYELEAMSEMVG